MGLQDKTRLELVKKLKYIYSRHKNTFKTTSDQNNRERSVQQQNSDLICIFRTIMVKKQ